MKLEPTRIAMARARAGLTKAELARRLDVDPRTITNYETLGAPSGALRALAETTGHRPSYFTRAPADPLEGERAFFRARRRTSARQKHAAVAAGRTGTELYDFIASRFRLPESSLPLLDTLDPESASVALRAEWGLGVRPLPNLVQLSESRGVRVLGLPGATADVDAFSIWEDSHPLVFLSRTKTAERSRFDLAHELGHLVLHNGSDADERSHRELEKEADRFASCFLLPTIEAKARLGPEPSVDSILTHKHSFRVSALALTYRAHQLGLLTDWSYRTTLAELDRRGFRVDEPDGMAYERSRVFATVLPRLRDAHNLGTEDLAERLGVPTEEVHGLTLGHAMSSVPSDASRPDDESSSDRAACREDHHRPILSLVES